MKLNLIQFRLLYSLYNSNENSRALTNRAEINQALALAEDFSYLFFCNRLGPAVYSFHCKDLGALLVHLKRYQKFEALV